MTAKVLDFKIPREVLKTYEEPMSIFEDDKLFTAIEFDISETLGPIGEMVKEHRHTVINWIDYSDFTKPFSEWKKSTKKAIIGQKMSFNSRISTLGDAHATLIGGERVILKRGRFILKDITSDIQDIARMLGVVSEVLFFEGVVYSPETLSYMKVIDYQVKELRFKGDAAR